MSKDTEVDMKDVELNVMDAEKEPMTSDGPASGEKNGSVKLKVPEDEVKFTGLSKDELMKEAGTPGWVRTRWVLLVLFWLGWLGMLAGAIVIIVQAPRCKPLPPMNWWNEGPLYQVSDLKAFSSNGIAGVESKLDNVNQLKVKGLVLGPLHTVQEDQPATLNLQEIDPTVGTMDHLKSLMEKAHKKGISIVLDLTPNYKGASAWFSSGVEDYVDKLKAAAEYWLAMGIDGIKVSDFSYASMSPEWPKLKAVVQDNRTDDTKSRILMGAASSVSALDASLLLNTSGVDLLLSDLLSTSSGGGERAQSINTMLSDNVQTSLGWGLGASKGVHLANTVGPALVKLYQLLLFTMPGTPVFTYGDEIGLLVQDGQSPMMAWDIEEAPAEGAVVNQTVEDVRKLRVETRQFFRSLSDLRGKERSILHGDYHPLQSSDSALVFLRLWDQSERYITAVNWGDAEVTVTLKSTEELPLPETAKVKLSSDGKLEEGSAVSLAKFTVGPKQGVILHFPYMG